MSNFDTLIHWQQCSAEQQQALLKRPALAASATISQTVQDVLDQVKQQGDTALRNFSAKFDKISPQVFAVSEQEISAAAERVSDELKSAMRTAVGNINAFHQAQIFPGVDIETLPGVRCQQVTRPVQSVGLYIPGGSAPLFSTVLMLATPAKIAGCRQVVLCSLRRLPMKYCLPHNSVVLQTCFRSAEPRLSPPWPSVLTLSLKLIKSSARECLGDGSETPGQSASGRRGY